MKRFIQVLLLSILIFFVTLNLSAGVRTAVITVNTDSILPGRISQKLFGGFFEFISKFINGPYGLCAQEFMDRGFDKNNDNQHIADYWQQYIDPTNAVVDYQIIDGGYNPNGNYKQQIHNYSSNVKAGVFQKVYLTDGTGNNFYVYARSDSDTIPIYLSVWDTNFTNKKFEKELGRVNKNWQKYEVYLPEIKGLYKANIVISIADSGIVDIDEASLMPENNKFGVKRVYYDLYKELRPGIIRYPGGNYADWFFWERSIGPIDFRDSPSKDWNLDYQRQDFGLDEFIAFVKILVQNHIW